MTNTAGPNIWLTISRHHREVRVYAAGSSRVRSVQCGADAVGTSPQGADVGLNEDQARCFQDLLAATTRYYPEDPDLDRQRARVRDRADELRAVRSDRDGYTTEDAAAMAELALSRHVGHTLADAAYLITQAYDHTGDRTVSEILSELGLIIEAMLYAGILTNPRERISGHQARITELRQHLPSAGAPA